MVSPDGKQHRDVYVNAVDDADARDIAERQAADIAAAEALDKTEDLVAQRRHAREAAYKFESATPEQ
jgi:hypothetical protein